MLLFLVVLPLGVPAVISAVVAGVFLLGVPAATSAAVAGEVSPGFLLPLLLLYI